MVPRCCGPGASPADGRARKLGSAIERDVDLHRAARVVDPADRRGDLRREVPLADEAEQRPRRVRVRGHPPAPQLGAVLEHHARGGAALDQDPRDGRADADLGAGGPRRGGDRLRQRAHPAAHVPPHAAGAVHLAHHVVEQHVGGARRGRRRPRADDRVGRERRLQRVGLEPAVEDVARGAGEDLDRSRPVAAEPQEAQAEPRQPQGVAPAPGERVRRRGEQRRLDRRRDPLEHRLVLREPLGVARGELRHLAPRARASGPRSRWRPSGNGVNDEGSRGRTA